MQTLAALDATVRVEIDALRCAGISFNAIAAALNRRGIKGPQGGRWYGSSVHRVLFGVHPGGAHRCTERCRQNARNCSGAAPATH
ncbi:MAG: recombinase family protein [Pseudomonadota bacterium]